MKKYRNIRAAKTKVLICAFVFAQAFCWFSHVPAQIRVLIDQRHYSTSKASKQMQKYQYGTLELKHIPKFHIVR